jgi:hypothetical protein
MWQAGRQCVVRECYFASFYVLTGACTDCVQAVNNFKRKLCSISVRFRRLAEEMLWSDLCVCARNCIDFLSIVRQCCAISLDCVNCCNVPAETAASIRDRLRIRDHGKRSYAQNVTLKPNSVGWTVSVWGPIRRRMNWVLVANRVRHSIGTVLSCQSGPRLVMIIT